MTEDQKKVLEELKANDQHLERGEIKLVKRDSGMEYFERLSSNHFERWYDNGQLSEVTTYKGDVKHGELKNGIQMAFCFVTKPIRMEN